MKTPVAGIAGLMLCAFGFASEPRWLVCPGTRDLDFTLCAEESSSAPAPPGSTRLALDGGCVVALGEAETGRPCTVRRIVDARTGRPLASAAVTVTIETAGHRRTVRHYPVGGDGSLLLSPQGTAVRIQAAGYEDASLNPQDGRTLVALSPGRPLTVRVHADAACGSNVAVKLSPVNAEGEVTGPPERDLTASAGTLDLGAVAFGRYLLEIAAKGCASALDVIEMSGEGDALLQEVRLAPGHCTELQLDARAIPLPARAEYRVARHLDGPELGPLVARGEWMIERAEERRSVCGLSAGEYLLEIVGSSVRSQLLALSVGPQASREDLTVVLTPGSAATLLVLDAVGLPLGGATARFSMGGEGLTRELARQSDTQGRILIPQGSGESSTVVGVEAPRHQPDEVVVAPGSSRIVQLAAKPTVRAEVANEDCEKLALQFVLERLPTSDLGRPLHVASGAIESCTVEAQMWLPSRPGAPRQVGFRLTIGGRGFAPEIREFKAAAGDSVDLGKIRLERGLVRTVRVTAYGEPVAGAVVHNESAPGFAITDADGECEFESMREGQESIVVRVEHPQYAVLRRELAIPQQGGIEVQLMRGGTIRGRVLDARGMPRRGAGVIIAGGTPPVNFVLDPDGSGFYSQSRVAAGGWNVTLSVRNAEGMYEQEETRRVNLDDGDVAVVDFVPSVIVTGQVRLGSQAVGKGGLVAFAAAGGNRLEFSTDEAGRFSVSLPHPGRWIFHLHGAAAPVPATIQLPCPCILDLAFASGQ